MIKSSETGIQLAAGYRITTKADRKADIALFNVLRECQGMRGEQCNILCTAFIENKGSTTATREPLRTLGLVGIEGGHIQYPRYQ